ncbi:MAG TPA: tRNA pseudouridine(55) synthase TruB, partial [Thermoanaerobaculia bacterium]|nr:tRNA pseudouridine(55) synthase TruB [Thermoanaerobaculia bacterium]
MSGRAPGPDGILLVDKPPRLTSHDVVDVVRRLLGTRRVGHTGTLDPAATGLLVLCVGRAGRLQSFLTGWQKTYEGTIVFGVATDTYDAEGAPAGAPHPDPAPSRTRLDDVCRAFTGEILQTPPPFSAKKVGGKKFYELARAGAP